MAKTLVRISKSLEFDAGHRVPRHGSKCRNLHGHRYKVIVHCLGTVIEERGAEDEGMLVDFGVLKDFMTHEIHDVLDHGMIVYKQDVALMEALWELQRIEPEFQLKIIEFPHIPTAENIARWCYNALSPLIEHHFRDNLCLSYVEVHETPTSVAYYPGVHNG